MPHAKIHARLTSPTLFLWESPAPQERALSPAGPWSGDSASQTKLHPLAMIHRPQCPPPCPARPADLLGEAELQCIPFLLLQEAEVGATRSQTWSQVSPTHLRLWFPSEGCVTGRWAWVRSSRSRVQLVHMRGAGVRGGVWPGPSPPSPRLRSSGLAVSPSLAPGLCGVLTQPPSRQWPWPHHVTSSASRQGR